MDNSVRLCIVCGSVEHSEPMGGDWPKPSGNHVELSWQLGDSGSAYEVDPLLWEVVI